MRQAFPEPADKGLNAGNTPNGGIEHPSETRPTMNPTQPAPRSNVFCLTGILASLLLLTGFLNDGNAHTASFSSPPPSLTQTSNVDEYPLTQTLESWNKKKEFNTSTGKHHRDQLLEEIKDAHPKKKKMGLALLFLGILAEEG